MRDALSQSRGMSTHICGFFFFFAVYGVTYLLVVIYFLYEGCGFVKFSNREMAAAALNALNGTFVMRVIFPLGALVC